MFGLKKLIFGKLPLKLNRSNNVVLTNDFNSLLTVDWQVRAAQAEAYFQLTTGQQLVGQDDFLLVQLTNPAHSGKKVSFVRIIMLTSAAATVDILRNADFTAGRPLVPVNAHAGGSEGSMVQAKYLISAEDVTTGGTLINSCLTSAGFSEIGFNGSNTLDYTGTDQTMYCRVGTIQKNSIVLNFSWWESNIL